MKRVPKALSASELASLRSGCLRSYVLALLPALKRATGDDFVITSICRQGRTMHDACLAVDLTPAGNYNRMANGGASPQYHTRLKFRDLVFNVAQRVWDSVSPHDPIQFLIEDDHLHVEVDPSKQGPALSVGIHAPCSRTPFCSTNQPTKAKQIR